MCKSGRVPRAETLAPTSSTITVPVAVRRPHNGPKIVDLAIGNATSQIVAREYAEYANPGKDIYEKETIKRIVELGQAHHVTAIAKFAREHSRPFMMTSTRAELPGLTD